MNDLAEARAVYLAAGGRESVLADRDASWYWRRAALLWREKADHSHRAFCQAHDRRTILARLVEALANENHPGAVAALEEIDRLGEAEERASR